MKILITGGAGFIGSHIADALVDKHEVIIVDNLSTGKLDNINKKAKFYLFDIRDLNLSKIFEIEKPQAVIHNAAQINVRSSVENPLNDADINIIGSLNIFENCRKFKISKVILASSGGTVYGEQKYYPADENHNTEPICPYGIAKLTLEKYLYYYGTYGIKYVSLRYSNVYGPRQDGSNEVGVIAIFAKRFLNNQEVEINGDGNQTRDYVFVGDVVDANIKALTGNVTGEFNISTGIETSVNELFELFKSISNKNIKAIYKPAKTGEQLRSCLSFNKARDVFGWQPKIKLINGLKKI